MPDLDCEPKDNADFVSYVRQQGYDAHAQIYADYPQRFEPKEGIDLTAYLRYFPTRCTTTRYKITPKIYYCTI